MLWQKLKNQSTDGTLIPARLRDFIPDLIKFVYHRFYFFLQLLFISYEVAPSTLFYIKLCTSYCKVVIESIVLEYMVKQKKKPPTCPIESTLNVIGKKWTVLIIRDLLTGKKRFGKLAHSLAEISPRTLSARLGELEKYGILKRRVFQEIPLHVEYGLTKRGHELKLILEQMRKWGTNA